MHLLANTQFATQIELQIQKLGTAVEMNALRSYQKLQYQRSRPLPSPENPILQKLLKYGYNISASDFLLKQLFKEQKSINNQFVADLLCFLIQTSSHTFVVKQPVSAICQSLGVDPQKEMQLENWDVTNVFRTLQAAYPAFGIKIIEALKLVQLDKAFFYPQHLIFTIFQAQFGLADIKCNCSDCSMKQQDFCLIESIFSEKYEISQILRLNLCFGLIILSNLLNEELTKQANHLKYL